MTTNRIMGVAVAGLGVLLLLFVIPANTETADYGMQPRTIPNLCAGALVLFGLVQSLVPAGNVDIFVREHLRVALFAAVAFLALWGMSVVGFRIAAPAFALVVMLIVGERRLGWLVAGVIAVPTMIWLVAVPLLDRTLP